jgi:IS4 transposase
MLDRITPERGALYLMDRAYLDFARLYAWHCQGAFFVMRTKRNLRVKRRYSHPVKDRERVRSDQTVMLLRDVAREKYPLPLRKLRQRDSETGEQIVVLTNETSLKAEAIGELYRDRWRIEVFFRWIKQHLRIKAFYGRSPNAVLVQVWIAVSVYVLIAILKKRLGLPGSLYEVLQLLSVTLFEKTQLECALQPENYRNDPEQAGNQLNLFDS